MCVGREQLNHPQVKEVVATIRRQSIENLKTVSYSRVGIFYLMCGVTRSFTAEVLASLSDLYNIALDRILAKMRKRRNCGRS